MEPALFTAETNNRSFGNNFFGLYAACSGFLAKYPNYG
jgi:hypothetical protein